MGTEERPTAEDPRNEGVSIIAVLIHDIPEAEHVQFFHRPTASDVDGEQNRHRDKTANKADSGRDLQVPEKKEAIEGLVIQHIAIRNRVEFPNPIEKSIW